MKCKEVYFSSHAVRRMFQRGLAKDDVLEVIDRGEGIADYPDDLPFPSRLLLGDIGGEPVHIVVARESSSGVCFVITVYRPDPGIWSEDFRSRRRT